MNPSRISLFSGRSYRLASVCLLATFISACGGSSGDGGGFIDPDQTGSNGVLSSESCSAGEINRWIDERMRDDYIYYADVPVLDLDSYTDPGLLVRDLRVAPDIYTSLVDAVENEQLISNSDVTRFGFWVREASDGEYHFADISGNSPMENAGVQRGDRLLAINDVAYADITDEQWRDFIVGEQGENLTATFTIQSGDSEPFDVSVTKQSYIESTVPVYGTYAHTDDQVGFLKVDAFRGTTFDELETAVADLAEQGISELILDLRYNGGGFTRAARMLASQIVGNAFLGEVYSRRQFNDKYSDFNTEQVIEQENSTLDLQRLFVLTTDATASASETLINGLSPLIEVVVIGVPTEGKPYTSVAQDYCGLRLNAMSTLTTNGIGESVINGIQPTCSVMDDFLNPADDINDALTGAAFHYMQQGSCPGATTAPLAFKVNTQNHTADKRF